MNKMIRFSLLLLLVFLLCSCGRNPYPALPNDPIAFEMGRFEDTEHDSALFGTLEYNGRTYISYGTISNTLRQDDVDQCIGYILQDENSASVPDPDNMSRRVYTLVGDADHNFLMDHDGTTTLMNQPSFWRAIDTQGKSIEIPKCIVDLGYEFWNRTRCEEEKRG